MTSNTIAHEREVKLAPELDFQLPDLGPAVGRTVRLTEQRLHTAYFDTADFRLWRLGVTLRHRTGDRHGPGTWTVKLPEKRGTDVQRIELSWSAGGKAVPAEAYTVLLGVIRRSQLLRIADLSTTRRRLSLRDKNGKAWGELDDDTVTVIKGHTDSYCFRELEIEHSPGREGTVDDVVKRLLKAGAQTDNSPKLAKAVEIPPRNGSTPLKQQLSPHARIGDVAIASIADGLDRLLEHGYRLRLDPSDPPVLDVHQARVAARRLRSDLKTFSLLLEPGWVGRVRDELRWVGDALGAVRDTDVLVNTLVKDPRPRSNVRRELQDRLADERRASCKDLAQVMTSSRYLDLLDNLRSAADIPPFRDNSSPLRLADRTLPDLVGHQWRTLRRRVRKAGSYPSDRQLHWIRIAAKQLRYAAETAAPVVGKSAKRTAKASEHLQAVLGDHHDAVGAAAWLRHDAQGRAGNEAAQCTKLLGEQQQRQSNLRREWPSAWGKVAHKKAVNWLR